MIESTPIPIPHSLAHYPGSKGAMGVAEKIISQFPPHDVYIDAFAGGSAVFRLKRPARLSVLIDADSSVIDAWTAHSSPILPMPDPYDFPRIFSMAGTVAICADARLWLPRSSLFLASRTATSLVYADPPYLLSTRTRLIYRHEIATSQEHASLLEILQRLPCNVALSGYLSDLYGQALCSWRCINFPATTRGGTRREHLWMNYPSPLILHDARFVGADFRQRERLKRKRRRWASRFQAMPPAERQIIATALASVDPASLTAAMVDRQSSEFSGQHTTASPMISLPHSTTPLNAATKAQGGGGSFPPPLLPPP